MDLAGRKAAWPSLLVLLALVVGGAPGARAAGPDILVVDLYAAGGGSAIIRVDSATGAQSFETAFDIPTQEAMDIAVARDDDTLVVDARWPGRVIRIDPSTREQSVLSSGDSKPAGIAVAPNGDILVTDFVGYPYNHGRVVRVDPATGAQTIITSGENLGPTRGIAVAPNGDILVTGDAPWGDPSNPPDRLVRVNPHTGVQTIVSSGGSFGEPTGIEVAPSGEIFVADQTAKVIRVDPATGAQTVVASEGNLVRPTGIAIEASGSILVADAYAEAVIRVNSVTGAQSIVSSGGEFEFPHGITLAPPLSVTCLGRPVTFLGWPNVNTIVGDGRADIISSLDGDDRVLGKGGRDRICAGGGNDRASGGAGNDALSGEAGDDELKGGSGKDVLRGGAGKDMCIGGPGKDRASGCEKSKGIP
jgi:streptogramin lyase